MTVRVVRRQRRGALPAPAPRRAGPASGTPRRYCGDRARVSGPCAIERSISSHRFADPALAERDDAHQMHRAVPVRRLGEDVAEQRSRRHRAARPARARWRCASRRAARQRATASRRGRRAGARPPASPAIATGSPAPGRISSGMRDTPAAGSPVRGSGSPAPIASDSGGSDSASGHKAARSPGHSWRCGHSGGSRGTSRQRSSNSSPMNSSMRADAGFLVGDDVLVADRQIAQRHLGRGSARTSSIPARSAAPRSPAS